MSELAGQRNVRTPMNLRFAALAVTYLVISPAYADVEKIATMCSEQICLHWWPKLGLIKGWHHDRTNSLNYNLNALAPEGHSFTEAETVMYANAVYKPRVPEDQTLASFIEGDLRKFGEENPGLKVEELPGLMTEDGKRVRVFRLIPSKQGQWEHVAYLEEGEYYMDFVISSRTQKGLLESLQSFETMVSTYREKPQE